MSRKFCPKCGKSTNNFYEGLCAECFLKKFEVSKKIPDKLLVYHCKECGNYYIDQKKFESLETALENYFKNLKHNEIEAINYRISRDKLFVTLHLKIEGLEKTEEKDIQLRQPRIICKFCTMKSTGYFTSLIQLRGNFDEKILKEIEQLVEKNKGGDDTAFISKVVKKKEGMDLYIGSKTIANKIAKYMNCLLYTSPSPRD